jgi:hypothetical protein
LQIGGRTQTPRLIFRFLSITDSDYDDGNMAQQSVAFESFEDEEPTPSRHFEV